jgi:hypothetical protein
LQQKIRRVNLTPWKWEGHEKTKQNNTLHTSLGTFKEEGEDDVTLKQAI